MIRRVTAKLFDSAPDLSRVCVAEDERREGGVQGSAGRAVHAVDEAARVEELVHDCTQPRMEAADGEDECVGTVEGVSKSRATGTVMLAGAHRGRGRGTGTGVYRYRRTGTGACKGRGRDRGGSTAQVMNTR